MFEEERNKVLDEELLIKRKQLINAAGYLHKSLEVLTKLTEGMRHIAANHPTMQAHNKIMKNLRLAEDYEIELKNILSQGNFGRDEIEAELNKHKDEKKIDKRRLEKEAEEMAHKKLPMPPFRNNRVFLARTYAYEDGYIDGAEPREKRIAELEAQLKTTSSKIINCIKSHLCKQDEDYDEPIISPKFLSDALDQMAFDGFEKS